MNSILSAIKQFDFLMLLWLFNLAFFIHELEEWNITKFELRNFVNIPAVVTTRNARAWIGIICTICLLWCAVATLFGNPVIAAYVFLPAVTLAIGNAIQHVYWTFYFRQYAPGVVTAILLVIPLSLLIFVQAIWQGYTSPWYVAALVGPVTLLLIHTVKAGNEMTPPIRAIYGLGNWLAEKF